MFRVSAFLLASLALVKSRTLRHTFNIAENNVSPDGFIRSAVTINGLTPGPVLTGNKGDDFMVLVNNNLNDPSMRQSLTIH
jgi:iron transport multicopper oxidase